MNLKQDRKILDRKRKNLSQSKGLQKRGAKKKTFSNVKAADPRCSFRADAAAGFSKCWWVKKKKCPFMSIKMFHFHLEAFVKAGKGHNPPAACYKNRHLWVNVSAGFGLATEASGQDSIMTEMTQTSRVLA